MPNSRVSLVGSALASVLLGSISSVLGFPALLGAVPLMPPGWAGTWGPARNLPPGLPPVELPYAELDKYILTALQPWALAKQEATEWNTDDTGQVCKPSGIFRQGHANGSGFRWVEAEGKLYEIHPNIEEFGLHRDRKSTRLNSSHEFVSRMPSSA